METNKDADEYKFLHFKDVHTCINQKVNLIGIIVEYGLPTMSTRGTDYCCTIRIVDETHHQSSITVNFFAEKVESLPHVASGGDVIQLCHVMLKKHAEEVNVIFNKKFSSFALYKGNNGDDFVPYQVSSNFHPGDEDRVFIVKLRKWLVNFQPCEDSKAFPLLREIKVGEHLNLACKIFKCCEVAGDKWFIYVWDGTDTPPNAVCSNLEEELNSPLPLQLEPLPLPRDLCRTFPALGSILRITFDQVIVKDPLHFRLLDSVKWVRLVNLRVEVFAGLWRGVFTPFTKLQYTPNKDCLILERQRLYEERRCLTSRMPYWSLNMPLCVTYTPVEYDHVGDVTLMDVLNHSEVTAKFKCVVRVVAALPCQGEDFRCSASGVYRMRLTLEDSTARIQAFVYAEDGETLFDGYPSIENLTRKLNRLLGIIECDDDSIEEKHTLRNPPWVCMCLKSYYIDPNDKWGSRQFRIFDTKIVGET